MALTVTSLASACTANDTKVTLTSATGCVVGSLIMVDGEFMLVTDITTTPTVQVVRGYNNGAVSSSAVAHAALAPVTFGLTSEFAQTSPLNGQVIVATSYSANGTITNGASGSLATGTLTWIATKAEFTPKTIQTKEERANLVYAIKVKVKNDGFIKAGMYGEVKL